MAQDVSSRRLIASGTRLMPVPLVPEIRLHQAGDPISLWQRTEEDSGRAGLDPPFWAFAWAAGQALARYLLDHPEVVRSRDVIDIASGSGLVAIAAALAGAAAVTAYDIDPLASAAIEANAAANAVTVRAVCADVLDRDDLPPPGAGLVLVADAFTSATWPPGDALASRAQARGATVLAADFGRAYPAPRPADAAGHLRRPRPARDRGRRHQTHHHLDTDRNGPRKTAAPPTGLRRPGDAPIRLPSGSVKCPTTRPVGARRGPYACRPGARPATGRPRRRPRRRRTSHGPGTPRAPTPPGIPVPSLVVLRFTKP
jgi:predicted nicotinamide N-methyase